MERPLEIEKNCCRKMRIFQRALFLATTFPKIVRNSIFLVNFPHSFKIISQNSQQFGRFVQTRGKINAGFLKFGENRLKSCIFQFSFEIFSKLSKIFWRGGGSATRTP